MSAARDRHQSRRNEQLEHEAARQTRLLAEAETVADPETNESTPSVYENSTAEANPEVEA
ncbi:hypothetical protein [Natrinema gelatinilyticum]|uniref:hypothetical protein n=1 Tax=Natrinema gelatinilyticum TaxID=2961571 RepID=UPI0020C49DAF|nr:hypothetical protein [Natrinema gelatinilyticum]